MELLIIIVICVIIYGIYVSNRNSDNENNNSYSISSQEVDKGYVEQTVKFFNSYLSLCANHNVNAICTLSQLSNDDYGINTKLECVFVAIDGEHADETFSYIQRAWKTSGDDVIKSFFGCEDLHYAFTETDEYEIMENGQTIIKIERPLCTHFGAKWNPTLLVIKQELSKIWPNVNIKITQVGMIVDYK